VAARRALAKSVRFLPQVGLFTTKNGQRMTRQVEQCKPATGKI